jgi:hypothetical protein
MQRQPIKLSNVDTEHTEYEKTFDGLMNWYKKSFEKLGWMILAKKYGDDYKVDFYVKNMMDLRRHIRNKIKNTKSEDRLNDLMIMDRNLQALIEHAIQDFK